MNSRQIFGAVRPKWISKKEFYRTPFNYCDRWCERCALSLQCRVYQQEQIDKKELIQQGKDPDSMEAAFEIIGKHLSEVMTIVKNMAEKEGIDLDKDNPNLEREQKAIDKQVQNHPLVKLTYSYTKKLSKLLTRDFSEIPSDTNLDLITRHIQVIGFYHMFIAVKVHRAMHSYIEELIDPTDDIKDSKTSAFIVVRALLNTKESLVFLANQECFKNSKNKLLKLANISLELALYLEQQFNLNSTKKL